METLIAVIETNGLAGAGLATALWLFLKFVKHERECAGYRARILEKLEAITDRLEDGDHRMERIEDKLDRVVESRGC